MQDNADKLCVLRTMFVTHNHVGFMTDVLVVTMVGGEWGGGGEKVGDQACSPVCVLVTKCKYM